MATADLVQGPPTNPNPSRIGRFALGQELGRGRMGVVYKATDTQTQQAVAMRLMDIQRFSAGPEIARERIESTAKAASGLNCPNIASVIGGGRLQGLCYLTVEYVPGTTLRQRLLDGEKFSISEFLDIARQLCLGLEHAHARKVYHGNLTPWNLVFESDGTLKVMDFGLAHSLVASDAKEDFAYVPYLSPEVLKGQTVDARADLFSAACMLYEILAGKKAFRGSSKEQVAQNIVDGFAPPAHESSIMIHPGLSAVLAKALAKDANDRYQSAGDFIRDLEAFQALGTKQAGTAKAEGTPKAVATPKPAHVSTYGVATKPVVTPKPELCGFEVPAKPAFAPVPSPAPKPAPVVRAKAVTPPVAPIAAPPMKRAAPAAEPGKKLAMLLAAAAGVLLLIVIVALWSTRARSLGPQAVVTREEPAAVVPVQTTPYQTPIEAIPAPRPSQARRAKPANVPTATAAVAATGELMISATPAGTTVQIDDGPSEPAPLDKTGVPVGTHTLIFSKPGYVTESRKVDVTAGGKAIAATTLRPQGVILSVGSKPAGATILVDGKESGQTPARLSLGEGQHNITLRKDGFLAQSTTVALTRGQESQYAPTLMPAGSTAEIKTVGKFKKMFGNGGQEMGAVEVRTNPKGAMLTVNGQPVGKSTPVTFMLNPGNYELDMRADGYRPVQTIVTVEKGGHVKVEENLVKF